MKIIILFTSFFLSSTFIFASDITVDSIGVFSKSGKDFILHKVTAKETFYSIARQYKKDPKELMTVNLALGNSLTLGDTIMIPTVLKKSLKSTKAASTVKHTIVAKETLFSISKKYGVSVESLKELNNLKSNELSVGTILKITEKPETKTENKAISKVFEKKVEPAKEEKVVLKKEDKKDTIQEVKIIEIARVDTAPKTDSQAIIYNKTLLGSYEVNEKALAKRLDGSNLNQEKSLALHVSAPVGTVIKVTNTQNDKSVLVKVIGKLPLSGENKNVTIMISKKAADMIDMIDERAQVILSYGRKND